MGRVGGSAPWMAQAWGGRERTDRSGWLTPAPRITARLRTHLVDADLDPVYEEMARDESRERDAEEWSDALLGAVKDDPR